MAELKDPRAAKPLIAIIQDPEESVDVQRSACEALGQIGNPAAIAPLADLLRPKFQSLKISEGNFRKIPIDPGVGNSEEIGELRFSARAALKNIGTAEALKALNNEDMEEKAAPAMSLARAYISAQFYEKATPVLREIVVKYPNTDAAKRAKEMLASTVKGKLPAGFFDPPKPATQLATGQTNEPSKTQGEPDPDRIRGLWLLLIGAAMDDTKQKIRVGPQYDKYDLTRKRDAYEQLKKTVIEMSDSELKKRINEAKSHQNQLLDEVDKEIMENLAEQKSIEDSHRTRFSKILERPMNAEERKDAIEMERRQWLGEREILAPYLPLLKRRKDYIQKFAFPELLASTRWNWLHPPEPVVTKTEVNHLRTYRCRFRNLDSRTTSYDTCQAGSWRDADTIFRSRHPDAHVDNLQVQEDDGSFHD